MHQNLRFAVSFCSSEEENHKSDLLTSYSKSSTGWMSKKWCEYPQDIVLQFDGKVKLKSIKILAHETKIPKRIELYVGRLDLKNSSELKYENAVFKRVGYMSLDDNSGSQYRARELKTAKLDDFVCSFLKMRIRQFHPNKHNLFNQVGLYGIQLKGQMIKRFPKKYLAPMKDREIPSVKLEDLRPSNNEPLLEEATDVSLDHETVQFIENLQFQKEKAAEVENFKLAAKLKHQIEDLRNISFKLAILEKEKRKAVQREEYDNAEKIKITINDLIKHKKALVDSAYPEHDNYESQLSYPNPQRYSPSNNQSFVSQNGGPIFDDHPMAQEMFDEMQHDEYDVNDVPERQQRMTKVFQPDDEMTPQKSPGNYRRGSNYNPNNVSYQASNSSVQRTSKNSSFQPNRSYHQGSEMDNSISQEKSHSFNSAKNLSHDQKPVRPSKNNMYDFENVPDGDPFIEAEEVTPVPYNNRVQQLGGKTTEDFIQEKDDWEAKLIISIREHQEEEPIKYNSVEDLQSFISVFGEYVTKCLHSTNRLLRETALKSVIKHFDILPAQKSLIFTTSMCYIRRGLKDKLPTVYFLCLELLPLVVEMGAKECKRPLVNQHIQPLIPILVKTIGDSNHRKNELAEEAILFLADHSAISPVTHQILKSINPKSITWKPVQARTILLSRLVEKYKFTDFSGLSVQNCMSIAQGLFIHNRRELRAAAVVLTMKVYSVYAEEKEGSAEKISKAFMKEFVPKTIKEALRLEIADKLLSNDPEYMNEVELVHPGPLRRRSKPILHHDSQDDIQISPKKQRTRDSFKNSVKSSTKSSTKSSSHSMSHNLDDIDESDDFQIDESIPQDMNSDLSDDDLPGNVCQFCLRTLDTDMHDPSEDVMNNHFSVECPMLEACSLCKMIIEIPDLTNHMLEECEHRDQVKQCNRCQLAIRKDEFENHIKNKKCTPSIGGQRCPLCQEDIDEGQTGWNVHLLRVGCPGTTRGVKFEI